MSATRKSHLFGVFLGLIVGVCVVAGLLLTPSLLFVGAVVAIITAIVGLSIILKD